MDIKKIQFPKILNKYSSNILLSCCYNPLKGDNDILSMLLKQVSFIGNLNINCLEYSKNEKVSTFYSSQFEYGTIVLINTLTRVGKKSATINDNAISTNIFDESFKTCIVKSNLSDF